MDNPEGQVTYPIRNRTAGLPTSSSTFLGVHCVFIFVIIIKPYGTINLIRQIQIEQNRCAMACQGCGAAFLFSKIGSDRIVPR